MDRVTCLAQFRQVLQSLNDFGDVKGSPGGEELITSFVLTGPSDELQTLCHARVYMAHSSMLVSFVHHHEIIVVVENPYHIFAVLKSDGIAKQGI